MRAVKTAWGATAVQVVHSSRRGSRDTGHLGLAHGDAEVVLLLKAPAWQRLAALAAGRPLTTNSRCTAGSI